MNIQLKADMKANFKTIVKDQKELISLFLKANKTQGINVVYIAGKVTGLPYQEVQEKFGNRQLLLEAGGYIVINPCELIHQQENREIAMRLSLHLMQFADYISLLPDWEESKGATKEKEHALALGIQFLGIEQLGCEVFH